MPNHESSESHNNSEIYLSLDVSRLIKEYFDKFSPEDQASARLALEDNLAISDTLSAEAELSNQFYTKEKAIPENELVELNKMQLRQLIRLENLQETIRTRTQTIRNYMQASDLCPTITEPSGKHLYNGQVINEPELEEKIRRGLVYEWLRNNPITFK